MKKSLQLLLLCLFLFLILSFLFIHHLSATYTPDLYAFIYFSSTVKPIFSTNHENPKTNIETTNNTTDDPFLWLDQEFQRILGHLPSSNQACSGVPTEFIKSNRYAHLTQKNILIAANFRNNQDVLPHWIEQTLKVILFVGTSNVTVSIYENDSQDQSRSLLKAFQKILTDLQVKHMFNLSLEKSDYKHMNRIELLAQLRNLALQPVYENPPGTFDLILFSNDGTFFFSSFFFPCYIIFFLICILIIK
jgi:hypothetical protein